MPQVWSGRDTLKRKISIVAVLVCLFAGLLGPSLVRAQSGVVLPVPAVVQTDNPISLQSSTAQVDFPLKLTFSLLARSDVNITDIRLRYTFDRESFANVFGESFIQFTPSQLVQTSWVMNMQQIGGLPPGTTVNFWWMIKDADGNVLETDPQQVDFSDNRYQWQSMTQNTVTLYWYSGDNSFASQLMTEAQSALTRLEGNTGATLTRPIRIYIYASSQDLQGSMIFPAEWTGGVAFPEYGIIAIGISPSNLAWGIRATAHEITHLVIHQATLNPYNSLPTWLDEGLAVYNEGPADPAFTNLLKQAIANNQLITMQSLASPFSAYSNEASLSYAESYSFVDYLISTYGQGKMLELLNTFKQGSTYDGAFEKVYGFNMNELYVLWKAKVTSSTSASLPLPAPSGRILAMSSLASGWGW